MATTKFEVGKVYITMADKFGDGEQTGKSVVIERTEGTVTFKHLASGEIFVREVEVFDAVQVEGCDGLDAMDNFIADNFGEEITTADIEPIEQVAEIESVENTAKTETVVESVAEVEPADDTVESVESAVETEGNTAEPEKAKVEVCKAYDAKDIIAACYPAEIAEIDATEDAVTPEALLAAEVEAMKKRGAEVLDAKIMADGTICITTKGSKGVWDIPEVDIHFPGDENYESPFDDDFETENTAKPDTAVEIEKAIYDKFKNFFGYKEAIINLEGDIATMEKLNQLYAEEYELRLANGYPADGMELLTAENDEVIGKRKAKIAEYQQKLEALKAELEKLKNKLAALKKSKVAA